jgi:predicted MFS family arabinose efflux permease
MFGLMYQSMYVVAVLSGMLAQFVADCYKLEPIHEGSAVHFGGAVAPFDVAIIFLLVGAVHIMATWKENYGGQASSNASEQQGVVGVLSEALQIVFKDRRIWLLGVVVACFEGAMFAFVFNWTPALEDKAQPAPLGLIFSAFMMACMCGASIGTISSNMLKPDTRVTMVCATSVATFFVIVFAVSEHYLRVCFCAFLLFECMVGVYFPSVGVLKSEVVPEQVRTTVYNIYRVPLNGVVVILLLTNLPILRCYGLCASLILLALVGAAAIRHCPLLPAAAIAKQKN